MSKEVKPGNEKETLEIDHKVVNGSRQDQMGSQFGSQGNLPSIGKDRSSIDLDLKVAREIDRLEKRRDQGLPLSPTAEKGEVILNSEDPSEKPSDPQERKSMENYASPSGDSKIDYHS